MDSSCPIGSDPHLAWRRCSSHFLSAFSECRKPGRRTGIEKSGCQDYSRIRALLRGTKRRNVDLLICMSALPCLGVCDGLNFSTARIVIHGDKPTGPPSQHRRVGPVCSVRLSQTKAPSVMCGPAFGLKNQCRPGRIGPFFGQIHHRTVLQRKRLPHSCG